MTIRKAILTIILLLVTLVSVSAFYDHATNVYDSGSPVLNKDLRVTIYEQSTGGTAIFDQTYASAINNGIWSVQVNADLVYGKTYYKDYEIDGTDIDFDGDERLAFVSREGGINASALNATGSPIYVNASNGNVGIGITNPELRLDVLEYQWVKESDADVSATNNGTLISSYGVKNYYADPFIVGTRFSDRFDLITNDIARLTISEIGNIGIGTTNPQTKFVVEGSHINGAGLMYLNASDSDTSAYIMIDGNTSKNAGIALKENGSYTWLIDHEGESSGVRFYDYAGTAGTRMFLQDGTGNVGIGTIAPSTKLAVKGNLSINSSIYLQSKSHVLKLFSSPEDHQGASVALWGDDSLFPGYSYLNYGSVDKDLASEFTIRYANSTGFNEMIKLNGVDEIIMNYYASDTDFRIKSVGSSNAFFLNGSDGNVGIGTDTPTEALDVVGNLKVSGSIIAGSITGGTPAGAVIPFVNATCPTGWELCDGAGTCPDLRGMFVRGAGTNAGVDVEKSDGTDYGATQGQYQNDSFQGHWHQVMDNIGGSASALYNYNGAAADAVSIRADASNDRASMAATDAETDFLNGVPRTGDETRPANYAMIYCMKQ